MKIIKTSEHELDHLAALFGIGLSYGKTSDISFQNFCQNNDLIFDMMEIAKNLVKRGGSHSKFLETIHLTLDITAPRYWWVQADTYRVGVSKQSESTMHTALKKEYTQDDFASPIPPSIVQTLNLYRRQKAWIKIKNLLPEGFLQRRIVSLNYKVLVNMIRQRRNHKLEEWHKFIDQVFEQVNHPEYLEEVMRG